MAGSPLDLDRPAIETAEGLLLLRTGIKTQEAPHLRPLRELQKGNPLRQRRTKTRIAIRDLQELEVRQPQAASTLPNVEEMQAKNALPKLEVHKIVKNSSQLSLSISDPKTKYKQPKNI